MPRCSRQHQSPTVLSIGPCVLKQQFNEGTPVDRLAGALHSPEERILQAMHGDQEAGQVSWRLTRHSPQTVAPGLAHAPRAAQWRG